MRVFSQITFGTHRFIILSEKQFHEFLFVTPGRGVQGDIARYLLFLDSVPFDLFPQAFSRNRQGFGGFELALQRPIIHD